MPNKWIFLNLKTHLSFCIFLFIPSLNFKCWNLTNNLWVNQTKQFDKKRRKTLDEIKSCFKHWFFGAKNTNSIGTRSWFSFKEIRSSFNYVFRIDKIEYFGSHFKLISGGQKNILHKSEFVRMGEQLHNWSLNQRQRKRTNSNPTFKVEGQLKFLNSIAFESVNNLDGPQKPWLWSLNLKENWVEGGALLFTFYLFFNFFSWKQW